MKFADLMKKSVQEEVEIPHGLAALPLAAYYRREPEFEWKRNRFYEVFDREMQRKPAPKKLDREPGFDGKRAVKKENSRKKGMGSIQNMAASPVEYFASTNILSDKKGDDAAQRRYESARAVSDAIEGLSSGGLQSTDFLNSEVHGAFGPKTVSDHAIDCGKRIRHWKKDMPGNVWKILEQTLGESQFLFIGKERSNKKNQEARELIKLGLDIVSYENAQLYKTSLLGRWPKYEKWLQSERLRPYVHLARVLKRKAR